MVTLLIDQLIVSLDEFMYVSMWTSLIYPFNASKMYLTRNYFVGNRFDTEKVSWLGKKLPHKKGSVLALMSVFVGYKWGLVRGTCKVSIRGVRG